ncbi:hypothetical protein Nmel_013577 [Mimus melanotis]
MLSRLQELRREEETLLRVKAALHDQLRRLRVRGDSAGRGAGPGDGNGSAGPGRACPSAPLRHKAGPVWCWGRESRELVRGLRCSEKGDPAGVL